MSPLYFLTWHLYLFCPLSPHPCLCYPIGTVPFVVLLKKLVRANIKSIFLCFFFQSFLRIDRNFISSTSHFLNSFTWCESICAEHEYNFLQNCSISSDLNTFPANVIVFAQIVIYHMLITGSKNYVGIWMKYCTIV